MAFKQKPSSWLCKHNLAIWYIYICISEGKSWTCHASKFPGPSPMHYNLNQLCGCTCAASGEMYRPMFWYATAADAFHCDWDVLGWRKKLKQHTFVFAVIVYLYTAIHLQNLHLHGIHCVSIFVTYKHIPLCLHTMYIYTILYTSLFVCYHVRRHAF